MKSRSCSTTWCVILSSVCRKNTRVDLA
jgi:hypothetical protein